MCGRFKGIDPICKHSQAQAGSRAISPDYVILSEQCLDESISDILD